MTGGRRLLTVAVAGLALFSAPAGALASQSAANARHWNDIRREGLTKILFGAALNGVELDRVSRELERLGGPDPAVTAGLATGLVARAAY